MNRVLIIGGGPAGSLAAILLARHRVRVTLIEQSRFPRDKVCGECLSATGIDVLTRHGLICGLRLRGAIDLTRSLFHASTGESCEIALPRPMLGISRSVLDAFLLDEARDAGAHVVQPARCESLQSTDSGVTAVVRSLADQSLQTINADVALVADGKGKLLPDAPPPTRDFGIKAHFTGIDAPPNAIELFGVVGHYGGLSAVEGGRWNSSFSVPADRLKRAGGDLDRLFADIVAENPALARRFARATRCGDWHTSPLPRFAVTRHWPPHIIPIGNAAAAIEPIGGEGMGLAMRSAELAVEWMLNSGAFAHELVSKYEDLWRSRRLACRVIANLMSSQTWSGRLVTLAASEDPITRLAMDWMGKVAPP